MGRRVPHPAAVDDAVLVHRNAADDLVISIDHVNDAVGPDGKTARDMGARLPVVPPDMLVRVGGIGQACRAESVSPEPGKGHVGMIGVEPGDPGIGRIGVAGRIIDPGRRITGRIVVLGNARQHRRLHLHLGGPVGRGLSHVLSDVHAEKTLQSGRRRTRSHPVNIDHGVQIVVGPEHRTRTHRVPRQIGRSAEVDHGDRAGRSLCRFGDGLANRGSRNPLLFSRIDFRISFNRKSRFKLRMLRR